jgi:putative membrane protein
MKFQAIALTAALMMGAASVAAHAQAFSDQDKTFLKKATEDNLAEIKLGELTVKTTKNPQVKMFAQKMVTDHTSLLNGIKPVAAKAGVELPTSPSVAETAEYAKMKVLTGETYDKSYVKGMVKDHSEDLQKMKTENTATNNPDIKKLTAHAADVIAGHKQMIDGIAGKMGLQ